MRFNETFKSCSKIIKRLIGRTIVDLEYGPDADGDPQIYYLILDNNSKIGIARVHKDGKITEEDRTKRYPDGAILRFQFLNWDIGKEGEQKNERN